MPAKPGIFTAAMAAAHPTQGFGTTENELVIYMLYFGWAYVGLLFKLAERAFRKLPIVLYLGCVGCAAAMAAVNIPGLAGCK